MRPDAFLRSIHPVSRETVERLQIFVDLFEKWSRAINLVARSRREDLWRRHVADSLQLVHLHPQPARWIDLGSGGGFPGVVTAIHLAEGGEGWVDLVESNQKKAAFLRTALQQTGARGCVHASRIEQFVDQFRDTGCVSARALADLDVLLELARPWLEYGTNGKAYFHKGRDYQREVYKARGRWEFDLVEHRSRINSESVVLEIANVRAIGTNS